VINQLIQLLISVFKLFPRTGRRTFARGTAWLIFNLAKKTRLRAQANISRAMPYLNNHEVRLTAIDSYKNIVHGVLECFWLDELEFEFDIDEKTRAILNSGRGVSIATMHMGCYEIVPFAIQALTQRSSTLSNIPDFLHCAKKVYAQADIHCINKKESGAFLQLLKGIRQNRVVSLHSDHYADDMELNFFSQKTGAPCGAAMLSAYGKTPLLLSYGILLPNGKYKIYIETLSQEPVGPSKDSLQQAMKDIYRRFEHIILQYPEHWYWSYKRWR